MFIISSFFIVSCFLSLDHDLNEVDSLFRYGLPGLKKSRF